MRLVSLLSLGLLIFASGCENQTTQRSDAHIATCKACQAGTHGKGRTITSQAQPVAVGLSIAPAADVARPDYAGDKGPAQVFEIIRPENTPLTIGRVYMDCDCVQASTEGGKTTFAAGERALVTVRQVKPATAPVFQLTVQVVKPASTLLTQRVEVAYGQ